MYDNLEKKPYINYNLDDSKDDVVKARLNEKERALLNRGKKIIEQPKDSTALKQLAEIGLAYVEHDQKTAVLLGLIFKNKKNNKRSGIITYDSET